MNRLKDMENKLVVLVGRGKGREAERGTACLPGCVWNATPRSLSPLERNIGFWTQA